MQKVEKSKRRSQMSSLQIILVQFGRASKQKSCKNIQAAAFVRGS